MKVFITTDWHFGVYVNNLDKWLNMMEDYFYNFFIPYLKENVIGRAEKGDKRGEWVFSDQFLKRFEATENKEESFDKEGAYTKESLKELLDDKVLQDAFNAGETLDVDKFINDLGVKEDGKEYYMKLRTTLKDGQKLFNSRNMTPEDLEKFIG